MASVEPYDENDVAVEEEDSDTEAPPPPKKMMGGSSPEAEEAGKGMMATRAYVGAIQEPSNAAALNTSAPAQGLNLEWVYGYRAFDSKSNLGVNTRGYFVYPVASLVIVYNRVKGEQTYFRGHTDDVRCLSQNPVEKDWFVSGQNATIEAGHSTSPHVCVFNSLDFEQSYKLPLPVGSRAVRAVAFSPDGKYVSAVTDDNDHTVSIWDWKAQKQIVSMNGDKNPIFQIRWNHVLNGPGNYEIVTVGTKHAFFWTFDATAHTLKSKRVTLGGAFPTQTWNSVTFSELGHTVLGGFDGNLLICKKGTNGTASKAIPVSPATGTAKAAKVFTLDTYQGGVVAGLSDKTVVVFDSKLTIAKTFTFKNKVTAVKVNNKDLIVGTQGAEIYELKNGLDASVEGGPVAGRFEPLTSGHMDGELWAVAPLNGGKAAITAGEDNQVLLWDLVNHKLSKRGIVNPKAGVAPKVKKASTTSLFPQSQCARAIAVSPDGSQIAVGINDGHIAILNPSDLSIIKQEDLNAHGQRQVTGQEGNWIQTIEYSPDGKLLAVGTHGSVIVILDAKTHKTLSVIKSHHSFLSHMDWSEDSTILRSNDGAYELLFHSLENPSKPTQITSASSVKDVKWATESCPISWPFLGVMQNEDGTAVNSVARDPSGQLIASADDHGKVRLFRYPAPVKGHTFASYNGHSSHVTTVRFTPDGQYLLSTGGHDLGLFQWKVGDYVPSQSGRTHTIGQ